MGVFKLCETLFIYLFFSYFVLKGSRGRGRDFTREFCVCASTSFVVSVVQDSGLWRSLHFLFMHLPPLLYIVVYVYLLFGRIYSMGELVREFWPHKLYLFFCIWGSFMCTCVFFFECKLQMLHLPKTSIVVENSYSNSHQCNQHLPRKGQH